MIDDREHKVRERAHAIWREQGEPDGRHDDHWHQASREVDAASAAPATKPKPRKAATNPVPEKAPKRPRAPKTTK